MGQKAGLVFYMAGVGRASIPIFVFLREILRAYPYHPYFFVVYLWDTVPVMGQKWWG